MATEDELGTERREKRISWIQKTYLALTVLACLAATAHILVELNPRGSLEAVFATVLYLLVYSGLRRRRAWVIPLVLLSSALSSCTALVSILEPADDAIMLVAKPFTLGLFLFFSYQISFFLKREVARLFSYEGRVLF
jgi:hypothetical protein